MKQKREEIVYGRVAEKPVSQEKLNRRARQAKKFSRKLREIFRKDKGLANRK